jgi:CcmD family protein
MTYLFWAFAAVWLGMFIYLYGLVRRSRALERQVADLIERSRRAGSSAPPRTEERSRR